MELGERDARPAVNASEVTVLVSGQFSSVIRLPVYILKEKKTLEDLEMVNFEILYKHLEILLSDTHIGQMPNNHFWYLRVVLMSASAK